ncbi:ABC transporter ATP-binding protein [Pedococcus bigeumensis]|uniref:ABC transporter ATP-binding protein n=1 Tax=Pedococcus bigeumensis TaxID=433644 RepID=UPI002FEB546E
MGTDTAAIRTAGLTKHFGKVVALDHLDLEVWPGEIFGFLGPNGAGKSTTIRLLLGLLRPTAGGAWLAGIPVEDVERAHRSVGYVPGDVALWPQLTGAEVLELVGSIAGGVDTAYRDELVERLDVDPSRRIRAYSKGNRQKIALVAAFMTRPAILLLDEPTVGLDPLMEAEFQAMAREAADRGQTVFLSSHLLDEVEDVCQRVAILRAGSLVEVAALADLERLNTTIFEATLTGPAPALADLPEVVAVEPMDGGVRVTVNGAPGDVLTRLNAAGLTRLHSRAPTLEQIFLTYYQTTSSQRRAVAAAHGDTGPRVGTPAP